MNAMSKAEKLSYPLLAVHIGAILFASLAFATILSGPPPAWLQTEPNKTIYEVAWKFSGPSVVVLGFLAALLHSSGRLGARRSVLAFGLGTLVSLAGELLGTSTGFPFGGYAYTTLLGYRILNLVPFPIPISWAFMLYCSLGFFYGMPVSNWIGWVVTCTIVARVMLVFLPPTAIHAHVSTSWLPLALYTANGVMAATICYVHGFTWAWSLGILAMALPVALALRAGLKQRTPTVGVGVQLEF
jgi:uncharacterized membrane protein